MHNTSTSLLKCSFSEQADLIAKCYQRYYFLFSWSCTSHFDETT